MKFKVHPLFFVFWAIFALIGETEFILYIFIAAAFHESAHICAYAFFGAELDSIQLLPFGISATVKNAAILSYKKEIFCAASGPLANLLLTIAMYLLPQGAIFGPQILGYCSFALFAVNLLPALPLDGGRIVWFFLLYFFSYKTARKISFALNILISLLLSAFGIFVFLNNGNISLLMISVYLIFFTVLKS